MKKAMMKGDEMALLNVNFVTSLSLLYLPKHEIARPKEYEFGLFALDKPVRSDVWDI